MAKTTARVEHIKPPGNPDMRKLLLYVVAQLEAMRAEVDRLSMKEEIDSLAARVADLEASRDP